MDGFKYWLSDSEWVMIRPSGTEPVLRIYVEAANNADASKILEATLEEIGCAEYAELSFHPKIRSEQNHDGEKFQSS